jgi:ferrous iron transport protein B
VQQSLHTTFAKPDSFNPEKEITKEIVKRYALIDSKVDKCLQNTNANAYTKITDKIDKIVLHPIWGYGIFLLLLLLIFQAVFSWAAYPMDWIDGAFASLSTMLSSNLPEGVFSSLLTQGILPGISGVLIFIPQIAILFAFIGIMEESGYMARIVYLSDSLMKPFGLNGKSVVPLMSGVACAIPAIMATRTIENPKERLITLLVTPFMTCAARLPVYTILIALVVPETFVFGFIHVQALALMAMYLLGVFTALGASYILNKILKTTDAKSLIMELPLFRIPRWKNLSFSVVEKTKSFVVDAGKIIFFISIVLWFLASYGHGGDFENKKGELKEQLTQQGLQADEVEQQINAFTLENSYAGKLGKCIEPAIKPLGYDWKIGIALIASFAAREVFVGTIVTIYSIGADEEDTLTIKERLAAEINAETGKERFSLAVAVSLLLFYAFAMQCMSTLAVVKRETKSWKWPMIQLVSMTVLAYLSSFIAYQALS